MFAWSILFLILTVTAAVLGFGGIVGEYSEILKIAAVVFLTAFAVLYVSKKNVSTLE